MNYNMTLEDFLEQVEFCSTFGPPCGDCPGIDAYPKCAAMILDEYKIDIIKKGDEIMNKQLKENILHELHFLTGLYVCDNDEGKHLFKLDYHELVKKLEEVK
jgi:hypothetical protein